MYCKNCGKIIKEDSIFCKHCGFNVNEADILSNETLQDSIVEIKYENNQGSNIVNKSLTINKRYFILLLLIIISFITIFVFNSKDPTEKIAMKSESVFLLNIFDEEDELIGTGSGFLTINDTTIITNYHVIEDAYSIEAISENNVIYNALRVLDYDIDKDIAILELDSHTELPPLKIDSSYKPQKGDKVIAIGSPLGLKNTVSNGIISTFIQENGIDYIQFTAPISRGSSGGPLFNINGTVIGITSATFVDAQNINLAIPIEYVTSLDKNLAINIEEFYDNSAGTLPYNIGNHNSITKYLGYYYHNYNNNYEIKKTESNTGNTINLDIYGTHVNVYNKRIYYFNDNKLKTSDLDGNNTKILIEFNPNNRLLSLFVNKYGIFITSMDENFNVFISAFDYIGKFKREIKGDIFLSISHHFTNDSMIATKNKNLLFFVGLQDFEEYLSFSMNDYITSDSFSIFEVYDNYIIYENENNIYKLDLNTGQIVSLYYNDNEDLVISIQAVYKDYIYFNLYNISNLFNVHITEGDTYKINISGNNLIKISDTVMESMNFVDDRIFYSYFQGSSNHFSSCNLDGNK